MNKLIQYYKDDNLVRIFKDNEKFVDIISDKIVDEKSAKKVLKLLGLKFGRASKTEWGFEVYFKE